MKNISLLKTSIGFIILISFFTSCDQLLTPASNSIDGTWKCIEQHEDPDQGRSNYSVQIDYDQTDSSTIYIYNFLNLENSPSIPVYAEAHVSGSSIVIPKQTVGGHEVQGNGTIQSDFTEITLLFTDDLYGGTPWQVSATLTRN